MSFQMSQAEDFSLLDLEEILNSRAVRRLEIKDENGRIHRIVDYSEKDICLNNVQRQKPFEYSSDDLLKKNKVEPHIRDFILSYENNYSIIQRNFIQYSTQKALERLKDLRERSACCFDEEGADKPVRSVSQIGCPADMKRTSASSEFSILQDQKLSGCNSDQIDLSVIFEDSSAFFLDTQPRLQRREKLVTYLPFDSDIPFNNEELTIPNVLPSHYLSVKINSFEISPYFEPIFGVAALYDIKTRTKLTENFYFDFNSREILGLIRAHMGPDGDVVKIKEGLFSYDEFRENVFLVIRLEKVLQAADPSEVIEPYINKEKTKEKMNQNAREYCDRLGSYRMLLGWTYVELKNAVNDKNKEHEVTLKHHDEISLARTDTESVVSADRVSNSTIDTVQPKGTSIDLEEDTDSFNRIANGIKLRVKSMYRHEGERVSDEEILKALADKQAGKSVKLKTFPVDFRLEITKKEFLECPNIQSPELCTVKEDKSQEESDRSQVILSFPKLQTFSVHSFYRNLLYIHPKFVNFSNRSGNARNIAIKIELLDADQRPQKVFFGKSSGPKMLSKIYTSVSYHNKTPQFFDEIKCEIPVNIDDGYHLMFTFVHISCKGGKANEQTETPIGYTWYPLFQKGDIESGDLNLPISLEPLPKSIGYVSPHLNVPNIKWLDNHKSLFNVVLQPVSTVHSQDQYITEFFRSFSALKSPESKIKFTESEFQIVIRNLAKASPEALCSYLYTIFDKLIALISCPPFSTKLSETCFEIICQLVKLSTVLFDNDVDKEGRGRLLKQYLNFHRISSNEVLIQQQINPESPSKSHRESADLINLIKTYEQNVSTKVLTSADDALDGSKKLFHEELTNLFVHMSSVLKDAACTYAWFFTGLIVKSCVEYLSTWDRFILPRKLRFRPEFLNSLSEMVTILTEETIRRASKNMMQAKNINKALADFVSNCFCLLDRSFAMNLIKTYNKVMMDNVSESTDPLETTLMTLKLSFMQIICSHEHFMILNLPFDVNLPSKSTFFSLTLSNSASGQIPNYIPQAPPSPSGSSSLSSHSMSYESISHLSSMYRSQHYLLAVFFDDMSTVLYSSNTFLQSKVIQTLCSLLLTHEMDGRLSPQNQNLQSKVAALYLPLMNVLLDIKRLLFDPSKREMITMKESKSHQKLTSSLALDKIPIEHNAVAGIPELLKQNKNSTLSQEHTVKLLVCFGWVLKNVDSSILVHYLQHLSIQQMQLFIELLSLCVSNFEYKNKEILENNIFRKPSAQSESGTVNIKWRQHKSDSFPKFGDEKDARSLDGEYDFLYEREITSEMTLIVLDTVRKVVKVVESPAAEHFLFLLPKLIQLLMHLLSCSHTSNTISAIFKVQRAFVARFPQLLFEHHSQLCADLCLKLLHHLASKSPITRSQAAASLYLLMRQSFEGFLNFPKVKMQITMAISTLVSSTASSGVHLNEDYLRRSLKTLLGYLNHDLQSGKPLKDTSFGIQVRDLVFNLHMILTDTVQMKNYSNDFEMLIDLMYRIAKGYQHNPDLRLTWLINVANQHSDRGNQAEAAQCMLHCAALVNEYLSMKGKGLPGGASEFMALSSNIEEESATSDDVISPDEEGICESSHFTEAGFLHLVEKTIDFMERANMYEHVQKLYEIMTPVISRLYSVQKIAAVHLRISENLSKIEESNLYQEEQADAFLSPLAGTDKRCFGTYFRVGFYGEKFVDLNGEEFIYKEPSITKLSEVSHRLEQFYTSQFGIGNLEVIKDSNDVDLRRLDESKAYVQITYVEPYFDIWEKRRRSTHLKRNYDINRFCYATPFTRDGKAHGELKDQFKRKTVLTTQSSFPYMKTRVRVIDREQKVLSPIEVAIEDVQKKTRELNAATSTQPADPKMLQMVLQGCIGTTVNQGPIQLAKTFLSDIKMNEFGKPADKLQHKLLLCFKDFSKKCSDALQKNETLIQSDQFDYQKELRRNYADFTTKLTQIVMGPVSAAELTQKCQMNPRTDKTLPVNLHTFTAQAISLAGDEGPVSLV
ncbi:unnamed protein product [Bursaphelenchus xylophilus]|uniref:(pine wood nematode) hypothetical protein n=1 Tax=Bursaphelenchus xylophilus TaxID=6326 RepID=A0A1I7RPP5_BURXY|nr:unnamed protein product [Bursaphelenchus xylophilus]CAG9096395.1 unnamed protein product [Bursaphelenchus xylophilus]